MRKPDRIIHRLAAGELAEKYAYPWVLSISAGCIFIVAIIVIGAGPEKHAVDFDTEPEPVGGFPVIMGNVRK